MTIQTDIMRPVPATLVWRLEDGTLLPADTDSLRKAGYVKAVDAYMLVHNKLTETFQAEGLFDADYTELSECEINIMRYLFEVALSYPTHFTEFPVEMGDCLKEAAEIERRLRAMKTIMQMHETGEGETA